MGIANIRALLVVQDTVAVDTLTSLLRSQGVEVTCVPNAAAALARLPEQPPDLVFAEFDDSGAATSVLEVVRPASGAASLLSVLLLQDESERAAALRLGAHFIVYKPVSLSQIRSVLLATKSLMSRERRRTTRVPIQIPVSLSWQDNSGIESSYNVYQLDGSAWTQIGSALPTDSTAATIAGTFTPSTQYSFQVSAYSFTGNQYSQPSNVAQATTTASSGACRLASPISAGFKRWPS